MRVLGPPRPKCQVEISRTDEFALGIDAPVRDSGDVANSAGTLMLGFVAESAGYDGMYLVVAGSAFLALVLMRSPFMNATRGLHVRPAGAAG